MDGLKKRLNESVQLKLSFSLSLAILVMAIVASIFAFVSAFDEANELQDDTLRQVAALFNQPSVAPVNPDAGRDLSGAEDSRVIVQYSAGRGQAWVDQRGGEGASLMLPTALTEGMQTVDVHGDPFRVFVKTTATGARIAVAQETDMRDEIARHSALRTLLPFLVLVPILLLIVSDLIRKMFQPIAAASAEVNRRAEQALHPIEPSHLPAEVRPFVVAINNLLGRVERAMETQRRFVADAAHELRSPMTALSLQAERLSETDMPRLARERLLTLRRGIERGRNLLNQLLTLANAQATVDRPPSLVSIQHLYRGVLEDSMLLAEEKHIDIGVEGSQDAEVWAHELDLVTIVKNLVDNAIRYTPDGGRVDLSVATAAGCAILIIQDSGPGIAVAERERVLDPFYRTIGSEGVGSGLGLSIVKAVADRIGAHIQLGFADEERQSGLCVRVSIPVTTGSGHQPS